jgi:membrane-associated phospholipid phosphatase
MLGSLVLATWIKTGLKHLVARTRPNVLLEEGRYEVEPFGPDEGPWHSFPSGHTAGSVAVARAVTRVFPQARTAAYGAAAAIALIQIPRGAHYPADVAAGTVVGVVAEAAVNRAADYLHELTAEPEGYP